MMGTRRTPPSGRSTRPRRPELKRELELLRAAASDLERRLGRLARSGGAPVDASGTADASTAAEARTGDLDAETLRRLVANVANDFNNILTAILGNVALARLEVDPLGALARTLTFVEKGAVRAQGLSNQLLILAEPRAAPTGPVDLSALLAEAMDAIARPGVLDQRNIAADLWPVQSDPVRLARAVREVLEAAAQIVAQARAPIELHAVNLPFEGESAAGPPPAHYVQVVVHAHGTGAPSARLAGVEPGLGVPGGWSAGISSPGLASASLALYAEGGRLTVDSDPDVGTTLTMLLPAAEPVSPRRQGVQARAAGAPGARPVNSSNPERGITLGRGRVLVMDDEEMVRDIAGRMLSHLGYEACFALDGHEAVSIYRTAMQQDRPFSAVLLDLHISSGMGGAEAISAIRRLDPSVAAIVTTGFSTDPVLSRFRAYGFTAAVVKPFELTALSQALRQALASGPA